MGVLLGLLLGLLLLVLLLECCWDVVCGLLWCCGKGCGSVVGLLSWDVVVLFWGVLLSVLVVVAVLVLLGCCGHLMRCVGVLLWMFC